MNERRKEDERQSEEKERKKADERLQEAKSGRKGSQRKRKRGGKGNNKWGGTKKEKYII
jgi:hypothetical protein